MASYEFLLRDPRSLAILGELRPGDVTARWTRQERAVGAWSVELPRQAVAASLIARQNVLEIRRDGQREFAGIILARKYDVAQDRWTLSGPDLKDWLTRRVVGVTASVSKNGAAETVAKAYVDENLGSAADANRQATSELAGSIDFTLEADAARGAAADYKALRARLSTVTEAVCLQGDLVHEVELFGDEPTGYRYTMTAPVDATVGSGGTPFAVNFDNVDALAYVEDYRRTVNTLSVLGSGTGDARTVRDVADAASVAADFRREGTIDARHASTNAQLDALGAAEITKALQASVTVAATPRIDAPNAVYRDDWDVGHDVTVEIPEIGASVDRRIVAATVELTAARGERITMSLGVHEAESQLRRLNEAIRRQAVAANE